jgi:Ca-activated chloride channel family protein
MLYLLWLLPLTAGLFIYAARRRQAALRIFMTAGMLERIPNPSTGWKYFWQACVLILALAAIIFALARPAWNRHDVVIKRSGRDVVFLLDVSHSMLAEDLAPNRLAQAKMAIMDTVAELQGDRVGLVAFAGNAVVKCPLTLDYGFFRMALENIGPDSVNRGGTMIGDALRTVLSEVFDDQAKQYKDVILITDGEDHDSFPVEAAKAAGEKGVRLIVIGLGDEKEGRRIPIRDAKGRKSFLKYKGHEVWTKLDADSLRKMAKATPGGRYLPVATGTINLGEVYQQLIASASKKELESTTHQQYEEKFQIFLAAAFLLLLIEMILADGKKRRNI